MPLPGLTFELIHEATFPNLHDAFADDLLDYFEGEIREISNDFAAGGNPYRLPHDTGFLRTHTFADLDVDSPLIGADDEILIHVVSLAPYARFVRRLFPALDRYFEDHAFPRWREAIEAFGEDA